MLLLSAFDSRTLTCRHIILSIISEKTIKINGVFCIVEDLISYAEYLTEYTLYFFFKVISKLIKSIRLYPSTYVFIDIYDNLPGQRFFKGLQIFMQSSQYFQY